MPDVDALLAGWVLVVKFDVVYILLLYSLALSLSIFLMLMFFLLLFLLSIDSMWYIIWSTMFKIQKCPVDGSFSVVKVPVDPVLDVIFVVSSMVVDLDVDLVQ